MLRRRRLWSGCRPTRIFSPVQTWTRATSDVSSTGRIMPAESASPDMDKTKILIFPLDIDDADTFIRTAKTLGLAVVGASSAMAGPGDKAVDGFIREPNNTNPTFGRAGRGARGRRAGAAGRAPRRGGGRRRSARRK